jgi:hypothetical protein
MKWDIHEGSNKGDRLGASHSFWTYVQSIVVNRGGHNQSIAHTDMQINETGVALVQTAKGTSRISLTRVS